MDGLKRVLMNKKTGLVLLVFLGIAAAIVAASLYFKSSKIPFSKPLPKSPAQRQAAVKVSVNNEIKTTLAKEKYNNVDQYVNLAADTKNPDISYQYYLKAYNEMGKIYAETKNPEVKMVMIRLASYLSTLQQFKESDVVIPK